MENAPGRRWLKADFVVERISDTVAWIAIYTRLLQCLCEFGCGNKGRPVLTTEIERAVRRPELAHGLQTAAAHRCGRRPALHRRDR